MLGWPDIVPTMGMVVVLVGFFFLFGEEWVAGAVLPVGGLICVASASLWWSELEAGLNRGAVGFGSLGLGLGLMVLSVSGIRLVEPLADTILYISAIVFVWSAMFVTMVALIIQVAQPPRNPVFIVGTAAVLGIWLAVAASDNAPWRGLARQRSAGIESPPAGRGTLRPRGSDVLPGDFSMAACWRLRGSVPVVNHCWRAPLWRESVRTLVMFLRSHDVTMHGTRTLTRRLPPTPTRTRRRPLAFHSRTSRSRSPTSTRANPCQSESPVRSVPAATSRWSATSICQRRPRRLWTPNIGCIQGI